MPTPDGFPDGDPRWVPNPNIDPFVDDLVEWVDAHLTPAQRCMAAGSVLTQMLEVTWLLADLRFKYLQQMRDDGLGVRRIAKILGIQEARVKKLFKKGRTPRKLGGYSNNKSARDQRWNRIRREYGNTAAERHANGFVPLQPGPPTKAELEARKQRGDTA